MKYLINNKVYDTEKSIEVLTYIKSIEHNGLFIKTYPRYRHTLYKTKNGRFFVHIGEHVGAKDISYNDKDYIELLTIDEVKSILNKLNDVETFTELFGEIEEG